MVKDGNGITKVKQNIKFILSIYVTCFTSFLFSSELNTVCEKNEIPFESYKPEKSIKRIEENFLPNPDCTSLSTKLTASITKTPAIENVSSGNVLHFVDMSLDNFLVTNIKMK